MSEPKYNDAAKRLIALRQRIIGELWEHPCYKALIEELKQRRPTVPYWNPEVDNTEQLKFASAQQKWHDVMMAIINPNEKYEKGKADGIEPTD
jgi:hypothetical protein